MTEESLVELGFVWEQLPSGRWNLINQIPFRVNGLTTIVCSRGKYSLTFEGRDRKQIADKIIELEFVD